MISPNKTKLQKQEFYLLNLWKIIEDMKYGKMTYITIIDNHNMRKTIIKNLLHKNSYNMAATGSFD